MEKQEATRYLILDGTRFANNSARDRCHVLDGGEWVETEAEGVLSERCEVRPLGSEDIERLGSSFAKLKAFLKEKGIGKVSRSLLLNRDLDEIAELLACERRELGTRTKMRKVYARLYAQQMMFQDDIDEMERRRNVAPGWKEGGMLLHNLDRGGEKKRVEVWLDEAKISMYGRDEGDRTEAFHGTRIYKYVYRLDEKNTGIFINELKKEYPNIVEILQIMGRFFKGPEACGLFKMACCRHGIEYTYQSL